MMVVLLAFLLIGQKGEKSVGAAEQNLVQMENSCFTGSITTCAKVGEYYEKKGNYEKAIEFFDAACIGGDAISCIKLYVVYTKGRWGQKRDPKTGLGYAIRAQELLGNARLETFNKQACDLRDSWACYNLYNIYSERYKNQAEAQKFLKKAINLSENGCKGNDPDPGDCFLLGVLYRYGVGVTKDESKAFSLYEKACELGNGGACDNLAYIYQQKGDRRKFEEYRIKSCKGGIKHACYELWKETKNKEYLEIACRFGFKQACDELFKPPTQK
jgi:TPR repeat protein